MPELARLAADWAVTEQPRPPQRLSLRGMARVGLDLVITAAVIGLGLTLATSGVDLGIVSVHGAAKPLLILLVVVPVRIAVGGRSWLADLLQHAAAHAAILLRLVQARVSPAVADTLFAVITVRAASLVAAFFANIVFEPAMTRGFTLPFANARFAEVFGAWDSGWYWDIATRGYYFHADAPSSVAFFPLYPMLMRAAAAPFGGGGAATWIAGIVVGLAAYVLALIAVHRLAEALLGTREAARRTVLYIAVFPWSLFMTQVYAESLFLLTSVLAVSRAYDRQWWRAGMWAALATLARPNGFLVAVPLALMALQGGPSVRVAAARLAALLPVPAALAGFSAYVYTIAGDPLGWLSAQAHWGYSLGHPPWQQLQRMLGAFIDHGAYGYFFSSEIAPFELLHGASALVFIALTPLIFRHLGAAMGAYVLVSLLLPLSSNTLEGLGRYVSVLFPAFMLVASVTSNRWHEGVVIVSLVFSTLLTCLFVTWQPIY